MYLRLVHKAFSKIHFYKWNGNIQIIIKKMNYVDAVRHAYRHNFVKYFIPHFF